MIRRWLARWRRPPAPDGLPMATLVERGFVAVDLETTGLDPRRAAVVAVAAIPYVAGRPQPGHVTLVNPGRPIPPDATAIHGVTDAMVRAAPPIGPVLGELERVWGSAVLVGHNVGFDLAVLNRALRDDRRPPLGNPALDVRRLAAALHPDWLDVGLESLAARLGVGIVGRHTADGDARAAGDLLLRLLPELDARGFRTVPELVWLQESAAWSRLVY